LGANPPQKPRPNPAQVKPFYPKLDEPKKGGQTFDPVKPPKDRKMREKGSRPKGLGPRR